MSIDGIAYEQNDIESASICVVNNFSDELKNIIRLELQKICHGSASAEDNMEIYSYSNTVREFLKRYDKKAELTKLGMIGELLCHILLFRYKKDLRAASPYFNMEEASIKKGFDLIISSKKENSLFLAEVKSGELGKEVKEQKIRNLIDLAKTDLVTRLSEDNATIWYSAINNVKLSLETGNPARKMLTNYLSDFILPASSSKSNISKTHVILVPVLFEKTSNNLSFNTISEKYTKITSNSIFGGCTIFAIQKSTLGKIENFLREEALQSEF